MLAPGNDVEKFQNKEKENNVIFHMLLPLEVYFELTQSAAAISIISKRTSSPKTFSAHSP